MTTNTVAQDPVIYNWRKSFKSSRSILGLYRDGLLVCSLVLDGTWRSAAKEEDMQRWWANMRPDDRAEVLLKLAELNAGQEPV